MVNSCCVPECKSGYKSSKKSEPIPLIKFPQNDVLRLKQIKAILCKNWTLTQNRTVEYVLIILLKMILKPSLVITENHANRLVQAKVCI